MSRNDRPAPRTITLGGVEYAAPFRGLLRPLSVAEKQDLRSSIQSLGVQVPVPWYDSPSTGPCIIDGLHRIEEAHAAGVEVPLMELRIDDATAARLALDLNATRRQLSPMEQVEAREVRVKQMAADRAAGDSIRTIAKRHGVSLGQAQRDLADDEGVSGDTPDRVTGADGKSYPGRARSPKSVPEASTPEPQPQPVTLPELVGELLAIAAGVPDDHRVVYAPPDPTDPGYPVTLGRLRAAKGAS